MRKISNFRKFGAMKKTIFLLTAVLALVTARLATAQTVNISKEVLLQPSELPLPAKFLPGPPDSTGGRFFYDSCQYVAGKALRDTPRGQLAVEDANLALRHFMKRFAEPLGLDFTPENYPVSAEFLNRTFVTARSSIQNAKDSYARPRPYQHFGERTPIPDKEAGDINTSYPSGHTVRAWIVALALVSVVPERQNEILSVGYEMGQSRVIVGYHYQSDVDDARLAASAVFARLVASEEWQRLRTAALEELKGKAAPPVQDNSD